MTYYVTATIKVDLGLTDASQDGNIIIWGPKADDDVDNMLYKMAEKSSKQTTLPVLPLVTIPTSIKEASNYLVKASYYEYIRDFTAAKEMRTVAESRIKSYIDRLSVDAGIYGSVLGDKRLLTNSTVTYIPTY